MDDIKADINHRRAVCQDLLLPKQKPKRKQIPGWKKELFAHMVTCDMTLYKQSLQICAKTPHNTARNVQLREMFRIEFEVESSGNANALVNALYSV